MRDGLEARLAQRRRRCQLARDIGGINEGDENRRSLGQAFAQQGQLFDLPWA